MNVQIVMDGSGDTRHEFDASDRVAAGKAEERFRQLTGKGFRAVALGPEGGGNGGSSGELLGKFDPEVEQTLFIPQLKGG